MIKEVSIFGKVYDIEYVKDPWGDSDLGRVSPKNSKIQICENMKDDVKAEAILHEIIHALSSDMNLQMDEQAVSSLSVGIYSTMMANRELFNQLRDCDLKP